MQVKLYIYFKEFKNRKHNTCFVNTISLNLHIHLLSFSYSNNSSPSQIQISIIIFQIIFLSKLLKLIPFLSASWYTVHKKVFYHQGSFVERKRNNNNKRYKKETVMLPKGTKSTITIIFFFSMT